jgi:hypothetical protein
MNHWEIAGRMAAEHDADLDREAARASLAALVRAANASDRRTWRADAAGWLLRLRRMGSTAQRSATQPETFAQPRRFARSGGSRPRPERNSR